MSITIPYPTILVLRRLLQGFWPSIERNEVFSETCMLGILNRLGTVRERSAQQSVETTERHVLWIERESNELSIIGRGVSEQGSYILFRICWHYDGDDLSTTLDPHGIYYVGESGLTLDIRDSTGAIAWTHGITHPEGTRQQKTKIRRLQDDAADRFTEQFVEDYRQIESLCTVDISGDALFFRNLAALTETAQNRDSSFCSCLKGKIVDGRARIVSSWPVSETAHGFIEAESLSLVPASTPILWSFEALRVLDSIFDRIGDNATLQSFRCNTQLGGFGIEGEVDGLGFSFYCDRPRRRVASIETAQQSIGRVKAVLSQSRELLPRAFEDHVYNLSPLLDAVQLGMMMAPAVPDGMAAIKLKVYRHDSVIGVKVKAQSILQVVHFAIGLDIGTELDTVLIPSSLAASIHRFIKGFLTAHRIKSSAFCIDQNDNVSVIAVQNSHVTAGVIFPHNAGLVSLLDSQQVGIKDQGPQLTKVGTGSIQDVLLILQTAFLSDLAPTKVGPEEPCLLTVRNQHLQIEAGDTTYVAGVTLPVDLLNFPQQFTEGDAWTGYKVSTIVMESIFTLFGKLIENSKWCSAEPRLTISFRDQLGKRALFFRLTRGELETGVFLADIKVLQFRQVGPRNPELPLYTELSPVWHPADLPMESLPPRGTVEILSMLQNSFRLKREESNVSQAHRSLTGMFYRAGLFYGATLNTAAQWEGGTCLGTEDVLIPPGMFTVAKQLSGQEETGQYLITGNLYILMTSKFHVVARTNIPEKTSAYPIDLVKNILWQKQQRSLPETVDGVVVGLGTDGLINTTVSIGALLQRLNELSEELSYTEVVLMINEAGSIQLIPNHQFGRPLSFGSPLISEPDEWTSLTTNFFIALNRQHLVNALKTIQAIPDFSGPVVDIEVRMKPSSMALVSETTRVCLMANQLTLPESSWLRTIENLEIA